MKLFREEDGLHSGALKIMGKRVEFAMCVGNMPLSDGGNHHSAALDPNRRALYDVEYRTIGKEDGRVRWVAAKGRGVFDDDGRCVRVIGAAIDITPRKTAEAALVESEARFRQLAEISPQFVAVAGAKLWAALLVDAPLAPQVRVDLARLYEAKIDYMPGLSSEEKKAVGK